MDKWYTKVAPRNLLVCMEFRIKIGFKIPLNDSYLQILSCTNTRITKLAVCCLQNAFLLSLAVMCHFTKRPSSSAICGFYRAGTDMSTTQTTIVRGHDGKFLRSFATKCLFGAFANPQQQAIIKEFCFMYTLILYLWIGNASTISLIKKICLSVLF